MDDKNTKVTPANNSQVKNQQIQHNMQAQGLSQETAPLFVLDGEARKDYIQFLDNTNKRMLDFRIKESQEITKESQEITKRLTRIISLTLFFALLISIIIALVPFLISKNLVFYKDLIINIGALVSGVFAGIGIDRIVLTKVHQKIT